MIFWFQKGLNFSISDICLIVNHFHESDFDFSLISSCDPFNHIVGSIEYCFHFFFNLTWCLQLLTRVWSTLLNGKIWYFHWFPMLSESWFASSHFSDCPLNLLGFLWLWNPFHLLNVINSHGSKMWITAPIDFIALTESSELDCVRSPVCT
jgi:hypothetical protein